MDELKTFDATDIVSESEDMRSYINELVQKIRDDEEVYEEIKKLSLTNGEVRDNIAKLNDFQEDYNYCKKCPGLAKCAKESPHLSMYLRKDRHYISCEYEPCKKIIEDMKMSARYLVKDFPSEWKSSTLKELDLSENRRPLIKEFAKILKGSSKRWLYAVGNHKVGKSYLFTTFANEYASLEMGKVAVVKTANLVRYLSDLANNDSVQFKAEMNLFSEVELLVLDDFGEEYKNEYIRDSIIIPLLSEREHNNRLTFFVSEFTLKEIAQLYSVGKTSGEIRSKQLYNILTEMCEEEFDISGASVYRK